MQIKMKQFYKFLWHLQAGMIVHCDLNQVLWIKSVIWNFGMRRIYEYIPYTLQSIYVPLFHFMMAVHCTIT